MLTDFEQTCALTRPIFDEKIKWNQTFEEFLHLAWAFPKSFTALFEEYILNV